MKKFSITLIAIFITIAGTLTLISLTSPKEERPVKPEIKDFTHKYCTPMYLFKFEQAAWVYDVKQSGTPDFGTDTMSDKENLLFVATGYEEEAKKVGKITPETVMNASPEFIEKISTRKNILGRCR